MVFPSADAPNFALAAFITIPMSFIVLAPTSAMISFSFSSISSLDSCAGKYSSNIAISSYIWLIK